MAAALSLGVRRSPMQSSGILGPSDRARRNYANAQRHFTSDDFERAYDLSRNVQQSHFVESSAKYSFYVGGLGSGKTFAGALRAVKAAIELPGSRGVIGSPTYGMLYDATQPVFLEMLPPPLILDFNRQRGVMKLVNGSEIFFRSMDNPDRLRGIEIAWFWLDEAPYCGYYAWTVAKARLRQKGYGGWGWATGTPRGKDGFYRDFEAKRKKGHTLYRASTLANAHNLPEGYVEGLNYSGEFYKQEVLGLFTAYEGLVYDFDETKHLGVARPATFQRVIGGIDWGYKNPTALLPIALDGDDRAYVLDEYYAGRQKIERVIDEAIKLTIKYGVETWYAGPDEPEHIDHLRDELQVRGLKCRVQPAENAVVAGIQTVSGMLDERGDGTVGLYVHPTRCPQTISEFGQYAYKEKLKRLRNDDEKPEKIYDHAMDALRYGLHSVYGGKARRTRQYLYHARARLASRRASESTASAASSAHPNALDVARRRTTDASEKVGLLDPHDDDWY